MNVMHMLYTPFELFVSRCEARSVIHQADTKGIILTAEVAGPCVLTSQTFPSIKDSLQMLVLKWSLLISGQVEFLVPFIL